MAATSVAIEQEGNKKEIAKVGAEELVKKQQPQPPPSLDLFFETVHAFYRTESLKVAIQLEVFTAIGEGADSTSAIAARANASERGIRILCDFLVLMGFLRKQRGREGRYELTPDSKAFLDRRSSYYAGGSIDFLLSPTQTDGFKEFASAVRKGGTVLSKEGVLAPDHPIWVSFAKSMIPIMKMPSDLLASKLGADSKLTWKVLDVAAGHGLYGIAIAKHNPNARIVAVDWSNVLSLAQENARREGVGDRYAILPGSALEVELGEGYDLVLIPNFLHHLDLDTVEKFLSKIFRALKPEGRVAILEFIPDEDRAAPPIAVTFAVMMLGITPSGDAYTFTEYRQILRRVGFAKAELSDLPPTYFRLVIAEK